MRDGNKPAGRVVVLFHLHWPGGLFTDAKKFQKVEFADIEKAKAEFETQTPTNGYVAMVQHYFASAWMLPDGSREISCAQGGQPLRHRHDHAAGRHRPGASQSVESRLFIRPQDEKVLESAAPLELVKDYGWLHHPGQTRCTGCWTSCTAARQLGLGHRGAGVLLKIAFYWLNAKAYASMAKMKAINPRIRRCASASRTTRSRCSRR